MEKVIHQCKKYYDDDGKYIGIQSLPECTRTKSLEVTDSSFGFMFPSGVWSNILSFTRRCYICKVILHPSKEYKNCDYCKPLCSICYKYYVTGHHCVLCKKDLWENGFPVGCCGCEGCRVYVCGICTGKETYILSEGLDDSDYI